MKRIDSIPVRVTLVAVLCLLAAAAAQARPVFTSLPTSEVIIEGGALLARGDLEAAHETPAGFGAETGFDVGFRYRQFWSDGWALSPSFHYQKPGTYTGYDGALDDNFDVETSMLRYGVDLVRVFDRYGRGAKLYLSGGVALIRNRLREEYESDSEYYDDGTNSLALSVGVGLRRGDFELSAVYTRNRPSTNRFWPGVEDYNWDTISLRLGFALPTYD